MLRLILNQQPPLPLRLLPVTKAAKLWLCSVFREQLIQSTKSLLMNDLLWWAICSAKRARVWYIIFHLILGHFMWYVWTWSSTIILSQSATWRSKCTETTVLSERAFYVSPSLKAIKGGGWAFALEAAKTCLELLNQQSRRGKQVPLSLSALELKEVFSQLALWIWFPLHQTTSAINNFRHNASTRHLHTLMWPKSFLSLTIVSIRLDHGCSVVADSVLVWNIFVLVFPIASFK